VTLGAVSALYYREGKASPAVVSGGFLGAALLAVGLARRHLPRGKGSLDLQHQTEFQAGSGEWVDEKTEEGKVVRVYRGEKGRLALLSPNDSSVMDATGLILSSDGSICTTYDLVFGQAHDSRPALGRCVQPHVYADTVLPDGSPNPKPVVVKTPGKWKMLTYGEVKAQVRAFGTELRRVHGIQPREKIAIWAGNSVEWMLADLACAAFNWTSVSVYDTLGPDAASYIVADSGAKVLVCEGKTFLRVPALLKDDVYVKSPGRDLKVVVFMGEGDDATGATLKAQGIEPVSMNAAIERHLGAPAEDTPPRPDNIATLMYTSGTTGMPKGVKLTHLNMVCTISAIVRLNPSTELLPTDKHLSYLPLAHIFERQNVMGLLFCGASISFASNGSKGLLADLGVVRPTLFAGVPRVYELVRDAVGRKMTGRKRAAFEAAMRAKVADIETGCGYPAFWDFLIFKKTKQALGGRVRVCVTGGAPISKDTLNFVRCALGPVVQGYGATETSAASTLSMSFDPTLGHVGPPIGTTAVRLVDVPEMNYFNASKDQYSDPGIQACFDSGRRKAGGEVWIGGPSVSPGYYDPSVDGLKPGVPSNGMKAKSAEEFFTEDGWSWFKTGDIGIWTEAGTLKIVDRRKNIFKISLGEYIPVEEVEKVYQDSCEFVDFVFLPKETKVAYVALCVVVCESLPVVMKWAKANGLGHMDAQGVVSSDQFRALLFERFQTIAAAKKLQRFMWIQKAHNIHAEYQAVGYQEQWVGGIACANGQKEQLLTATFKARRSQLDQYFAPVYPKLYPDRPADHILP